jgi:hypothetical protein
MNNGRDLTRFGNNAALNNTRLVGQTIGDRKQIQERTPAPSVQRERPADGFLDKRPTESSDHFRSGNTYNEARRYDRNVPYRHARTTPLYEGKVSPTTVSDEQRLAFLDKIISDPALHSKRSIVSRPAAQASATPRAAAAAKTVAGMVRAQAPAGRPPQNAAAPRPAATAARRPAPPMARAQAPRTTPTAAAAQPRPAVAPRSPLVRNS